VAKRRYLLSRAADADLDAIFSYLAHQSGVERAVSVFERVEETLESLAAFATTSKVSHEVSSFCDG
jgi:plasmid stabilization system protein ParE